MKKSVKRTCIVCRTKHDKSHFIKVVKSKDGTVKIAESRDAGRGAYICQSDDCIKKCIKSKALNRAFKMPVDESIYQELEAKLGGGKG